MITREEILNNPDYQKADINQKRQYLIWVSKKMADEQGISDLKQVSDYADWITGQVEPSILTNKSLPPNQVKESPSNLPLINPVFIPENMRGEHPIKGFIENTKNDIVNLAQMPELMLNPVIQPLINPTPPTGYIDSKGNLITDSGQNNRGITQRLKQSGSALADIPIEIGKQYWEIAKNPIRQFLQTPVGTSLMVAPIIRGALGVRKGLPVDQYTSTEPMTTPSVKVPSGYDNLGAVNTGNPGDSIPPVLNINDIPYTENININNVPKVSPIPKGINLKPKAPVVPEVNKPIEPVIEPVKPSEPLPMDNYKGIDSQPITDNAKQNIVKVATENALDEKDVWELIANPKYKGKFTLDGKKISSDDLRKHIGDQLSDKLPEPEIVKLQESVIPTVKEEINPIEPSISPTVETVKPIEIINVNSENLNKVKDMGYKDKVNYYNGFLKNISKENKLKVKDIDKMLHNYLMVKYKNPELLINKLTDWNKNYKQNIEEIYNYFIGDSPHNPILTNTRTGQINQFLEGMGSDIKIKGINKEALKKTQELYNSIARSVGQEHIYIYDKYINSLSNNLKPITEPQKPTFYNPENVESNLKLSTKKTGKIFDNLVDKERNTMDGVLYNWNESEINARGTGIKAHIGREGPLSRNNEYNVTYSPTKSSFIKWLMSDEPFNEKVYGKDIKNNIEWTDNINKLRNIVNEHLTEPTVKPIESARLSEYNNKMNKLIDDMDNIRNNISKEKDLNKKQELQKQLKEYEFKQESLDLEYEDVTPDVIPNDIPFDYKKIRDKNIGNIKIARDKISKEIERIDKIKNGYQEELNKLEENRFSMEDEIKKTYHVDSIEELLDEFRTNVSNLDGLKNKLIKELEKREELTLDITEIKPKINPITGKQIGKKQYKGTKKIFYDNVAQNLNDNKLTFDEYKDIALNPNLADSRQYVLRNGSMGSRLDLVHDWNQEIKGDMPNKLISLENKYKNSDDVQVKSIEPPTPIETVKGKETVSNNKIKDKLKKQDYELTLEEYIDKSNREYENIKNKKNENRSGEDWADEDNSEAIESMDMEETFALNHEVIIKKAIKEKKLIPESVKLDYPELFKTGQTIVPGFDEFNNQMKIDKTINEPGSLFNEGKVQNIIDQNKKIDEQLSVDPDNPIVELNAGVNVRTNIKKLHDSIRNSESYKNIIKVTNGWGNQISNMALTLPRDVAVKTWNEKRRVTNNLKEIMFDYGYKINTMFKEISRDGQDRIEYAMSRINKFDEDGNPILDVSHQPLGVKNYGSEIPKPGSKFTDKAGNVFVVGEKIEPNTARRLLGKGYKDGENVVRLYIERGADEAKSGWESLSIDEQNILKSLRANSENIKYLRYRNFTNNEIRQPAISTGLNQAIWDIKSSHPDYVNVPYVPDVQGIKGGMTGSLNKSIAGSRKFKSNMSEYIELQRLNESLDLGLDLGDIKGLEKLPLSQRLIISTEGLVKQDVNDYLIRNVLPEVSKTLDESAIKSGAYVAYNDLNKSAQARILSIINKQKEYLKSKEIDPSELYGEVRLLGDPNRTMIPTPVAELFNMVDKNRKSIFPEGTPGRMVMDFANITLNEYANLLNGSMLMTLPFHVRNTISQGMVQATKFTKDGYKGIISAVIKGDPKEAIFYISNDMLSFMEQFKRSVPKNRMLTDNLSISDYTKDYHRNFINPLYANKEVTSLVEGYGFNKKMYYEQSWIEQARRYADLRRKENPSLNYKELYNDFMDINWKNIPEKYWDMLDRAELESYNNIKLHGFDYSLKPRFYNRLMNAPFAVGKLSSPFLNWTLNMYNMMEDYGNPMNVFRWLDDRLPAEVRAESGAKALTAITVVSLISNYFDDEKLKRIIGFYKSIPTDLTVTGRIRLWNNTDTDTQMWARLIDMPYILPTVLGKGLATGAIKFTDIPNYLNQTISRSPVVDFVLTGGFNYVNDYNKYKPKGTVLGGELTNITPFSTTLKQIRGIPWEAINKTYPGNPTKYNTEFTNAQTFTNMSRAYGENLPFINKLIEEPRTFKNNLGNKAIKKNNWWEYLFKTAFINAIQAKGRDIDRAYDNAQTTMNKEKRNQDIDIKTGKNKYEYLTNQGD